MNKKRFCKESLFTVPNLLSVFRLILIPFIVYYYLKLNNSKAAIGLLILSGATDILDGKIARKFNMVSDIGKILDPIADKFTQGIAIICLCFKYPHMVYLVGLFVVKEITMIILGYAVIEKTDVVNSSKWHGKLNTVILYAAIVVLLFFEELPGIYVDCIIIFCSVSIITTFILYCQFYRKFIVRSFPGKQ